MLIVADSSAIINILEIDGIDYLHNIYDKIVLPRKVYRELVTTYYRETRLQYLNDNNIFQVIECTDIEYLNSITDSHIHNGEKEALTLCKELNINELLIDDKRAIRHITNNNLKIVTSYNIVIENSMKNYIDLTKFKEVFTKLLDVNPLKETNMLIVNNLLELTNSQNINRNLEILKNVINQTYNNGR